MDHKLLDLLYRSFDDQLTPEEQSQLEDALANSTTLQKEKERIAAMRKTVSESAVESFEPFFAERVMRQIHTEKGEDFFASLLWAFRRIALAGAIAAILLLANNLSRGDDISLDSVLLMPQLTLEETWELDDLAEAE